MNDDPQVTLGVSEDTVGDLALFKPHLTHITLDHGKPREWGIPGPVEGPHFFPTYCPPWDSAPGSSMYMLRVQ